MKRFFCLFITLLTLFLFPACRSNTGNSSDLVRFYYPRIDPTYASEDSVIASEVQDELSRSSNLAYLLAHYLNGPTDNRLYSPFPNGLRIEDLQMLNDELTVTFTTHLTELTDYELTKACACFAMTCMDLTNAGEVTICTIDSDRKVQIIMSLTSEDFILMDLTPNPTNGGTE